LLDIGIVFFNQNDGVAKSVFAPHRNLFASGREVFIWRSVAIEEMVYKRDVAQTPRYEAMQKRIHLR
jgi:hypothetical protein